MATFMNIKKIFFEGLLVVVTSGHNGKYLVWNLPCLGVCKKFYSRPNPTLWSPDTVFVGYSNKFTNENLSFQEELKKAVTSIGCWINFL